MRQRAPPRPLGLDLPLVERGFNRLEQEPYEFLFIENVGNLVCPASHDLGEHLRVLLVSSTEGDDKPGKYPKAFRTSDVLVITKADLLPYVPFSVRQAEKDARRVQPALKIFTLSAQNGDGACPRGQRDMHAFKLYRGALLQGLIHAERSPSMSALAG